MKNKRAFTLIETLIMVAVIGIIATVTVVSLKGMRPDKDVMMIKKAYSTIVQTVDALANDTELYPYAHIAMLVDKLTPVRVISSATMPARRTEYGCTVPKRTSCIDEGGFFDEITCTCVGKKDATIDGNAVNEGDYDDRMTDAANGEDNYGSGTFSDVSVRNGANYSTQNKFSYNFMLALNPKTVYAEGDDGPCDFITDDGMHWEISDYFNDKSKNYAIIQVDINGSDVGSNSSTGTNPDTFSFIVGADGTVNVYGEDAAATKARQVLSSRDIKAKN